MIIASSYNFQGSEKDLSPLIPNVAKMLHFASLWQCSTFYDVTVMLGKFFLKHSESFL